MMNGSQRKHRKSVGYIVEIGNGGAGSLCYGLTNAKKWLLLFGNPVTVFKKLAHARRAIKETKEEKPEWTDRMTVRRVAFCENI